MVIYALSYSTRRGHAVRFLTLLPYSVAHNDIHVHSLSLAIRIFHLLSDYKMVFEVTSNKAELVGLTAASFFAWLFLQLPSTERYQFIWTNWYMHCCCLRSPFLYQVEDLRLPLLVSICTTLHQPGSLHPLQARCYPRLSTSNCKRCHSHGANSRAVRRGF